MHTDRNANGTAKSNKKAKNRAAIFMNRWLNDGEVEKWIKTIRNAVYYRISKFRPSQIVNTCNLRATCRHPIITIAWKNRPQL